MSRPSTQETRAMKCIDNMFLVETRMSHKLIEQNVSVYDTKEDVSMKNTMIQKRRNMIHKKHNVNKKIERKVPVDEMKDITQIVSRALKPSDVQSSHGSHALWISLVTFL